MYLNRLSGEQKELFLDLCIHMSRVDGVFAEEEKHYIQDYCVEMKLDTVRYSTEKSLEDVISKIIEKSTSTDLKIIFFEITGLALSDKEFKTSEQELINNLVKLFNLSIEFKETVLEYLKKIIDIYASLNQLIFE